MSVLLPDERFRVDVADCREWLRSMPDRFVSLVLFSPPYSAARRYGELNFKLRGQQWVDWLRPIVVDACRVSAGLVLVNAAGVVKNHRYCPAVEWLVADLTRLDGIVCGPSPYAWVRNGVPGSGSKHSGYHRRCWEPVYAFAMPDRLPLVWHDQLAFGKPPKFGTGGECSNRNVNGARVNQWGGNAKGMTTRKTDGTMQPGVRPSHRNAFGVSTTSTRRRQGQDHREPVKWTAPCSGNGDIATRDTTPPAIACPPNVIRTGNGGNQLGHPLAHENEAPMNLKIAERFVCWFCPPGGIVADCFAGSSTTGHACLIHGRRFVGCDLRPSQVELSNKRLAGITPSMFDGQGVPT